MLTGQNGLLEKARESKKNYETSSIKEEIELEISSIQIDENYKGNSLTLEKLTGYGGLLSSKLSIDSWKNEKSGTYKGKYFVINDDFSVSISEEKYDYKSISSMKLDYNNLSNGQIVTTKAYYENANESGGGTYKITNEASSFIDDGGRFIKLNENSDLWAVLQVANNEIDICQYGAYGDGTNDDTEFIKNAVKSNTETIHIAKGTYMISSEITIPSNTMIIGNGDSIFLACEGYKSGTNMFIASNKENITLKNIAISGNSGVNTREKGYSDQDGIHLLDLWGSKNILVENCTFKDNIYTAIRIVTGNNITVNKSNFYSVDCGIISLGNNGVSNLKISDNVFDGHDNSEPISLFTSNATYENIIISGNKISNKIYGTAILFKSGNKFKNVTISNNIIENCLGGMNINDVDGNSSIMNNTIKSVPHGVTLSNCENIVIENLSVDDTKMNGLTLTDCKNMDIRKIKLSGFAKGSKDAVGLSLNGNGDNTKISGNVILTDGSLAQKGIAVYGNNYDFSNVKFAGDFYFGIQFFPNASGNIFHTDNYVGIAYETKSIVNDIVVNAEKGFSIGTVLSNYQARFCTDYIVNRTANTEYPLSDMMACQDGFKRKLIINAKVDTKLESKNSVGGIVWSKDRTIKAGNSETIYLVCKNGIWNEIHK